MSKKQIDNMQYGLDVMDRFICSIDYKVQEIEQDLFYLKQWLSTTKEGNPSVMKIRGHKKKR